MNKKETIENLRKISNLTIKQANEIYDKFIKNLKDEINRQQNTIKGYGEDDDWRSMF